MSPGFTTTTSVLLDDEVSVTTIGTLAWFIIVIVTVPDSPANVLERQENVNDAVLGKPSVQVPLLVVALMSFNGSVTVITLVPVIAVKERTLPKGTKRRPIARAAIRIFLLLNLGFSVILDDCFGTI